MAQKVKGRYHGVIDGTIDFTHKIKPTKQALCRKCKQIPFSNYLPSSFTQSSSQTSIPKGKSTIFCLELEDIIAHRQWCKFCGLLYKSICRPEYDLFKSEHIGKHLGTSEKLKDLETFDQWATTFSTWKKWTEGEDNWPFGYTRDQKEAADHAEETAKELFRSAEDKDLKAGTVSGMFETDANFEKALQVGSLALGFGGIAKPGGRAVAGGQMIMSQMAMFGMGKAKALPCLFIVQAYARGEEKDGVLSVRAFAFGRAFRASLKEISHFSLRLEQSEPRPQGAQLWYGRILNPRIDIPFFQKCLATCQMLHGDVCGKLSCPPQSDQQAMDGNFHIRFIDVQRMQIVEENFARIIQPPSHPDHRSYVVLSYTWGNKEWSEHTDSEGRTFWYSSDPEESTYTPYGHTRLRRSNIKGLMRPGSLEGDYVYIPKTIRDAIEVCKMMGQQYLWVDSLCIIQDEEDPDLHANIARMGRIYSEAVFTIVAGDAPTADSGIKGVTTDRKVPDQVIEKVAGEVQLFLPVSMQQKLDPWDSRAWTFQEKLLSKRMLVLANGYAVWRCRGGTWREDVNARDGNSDSASFSWPHLTPVPKIKDKLEKSGLRFLEEDESVRLYRLPAFAQYVTIVEDFSGRHIRDSWEILDAFEGLQRVLAAPEILDSAFRYGLPTKFMDSALLWQPRRSISRRKNKEDNGGNILAFSPPSWSWAGWESMDTKSKEACISFNEPFDVQADERGLMMRPNHIGEERMRSLHGSVYGVVELELKSGTPPSRKLVDQGLLSQRGVLSQVARDWESFPQTLRPVLPPRGLLLKKLSDRHLVFCTAVASISLGRECFRIKIRSQTGDTEVFRESFQDSLPVGQGMPVSRERWIVDAKSNKVGTVKLHSEAKLTKGNTYDTFTAMVLSEAQYLGNEERVDVSGYPLYNIMIIEKRGNNFAERVGLGKLYKSAWKKMRPTQETVILE